MRLLPFTTYEAAKAADLLAFEFLQMTSGAGGSEWSGVFAGYDGTWAILFDDCIAGAFTEEELAEVIEGEPLIRDKGKFVSGNWEPYTPPPVEGEDV